MAKSAKSGTLDFESALKELESIVATLEKGEISLGVALKNFERGIALTRECQKALKQAELKVEMLLEQDGAPRLARFDPENE